jgi:uncharacterized protein YndB with AHSA1/START domain
MASLIQRLFGPIEVAETIPAPPDDVYAVLSDPDSYPDWLVGADRMRAVDPDFPKPGTSFHHSVGPGGPLTIDDRTESVAAEPNRHLGLMVHAGPFHGRVDFRRSADGSATRVRLTEQPTGPLALLTPLVRPSLAGRNKASLMKLRTLITDRTTSKQAKA